jgi:ribose transport system permease protein
MSNHIENVTATSEHRETRPDRTLRYLAVASLRRFSAVWLLLIFLLTFSLTAPGSFPTMTTLRLVLSEQVVAGIVALAVLIPLVGGAFDLSVGATLATGMVIVTGLSRHGWSPIPEAIVAIIVCALVGVVNGYFIIKLRVNSFIATLGMSELLSAVTLKLSSNSQVLGVFPTWFQNSTSADLFGIPLGVYYLAVLAGIVWYVLEHTPIGRALFATGGNPEAARLAGLPTDRLVWGTLVASAMLSGLAGVLLASQVGLFTSDYGPNYLFPAFAAVFFGATQIRSRANVWGTLLAMYTLAVGVAGLQLTFFGNEYWISPLFNGAALLVAVGLAVRSQRGGRGAGVRLRRLRDEPGGADEPDGGIGATKANVGEPVLGGRQGASIPER